MSEPKFLVTGETSDGYHTFNELYAHRNALYKALCRHIAKCPENKSNPMYWTVWKSRTHNDGSTFDGWFIMGINWAKGRQISYHLPDSEWDSCDFAQELLRAPAFDGHTSSDVLERINRL